MNNKILKVDKHQVKFNYNDKRFSYIINGDFKEEDIINEIKKINNNQNFKVVYEHYRSFTGLNKDNDKLQNLQEEIDRIPKTDFYDE